MEEPAPDGHFMFTHVDEFTGMTTAEETNKKAILA
jgi:hypothetical protein